MSEITRALWITLAGMGLTFLGIFVIWGMMGLSVRWFRDRKEEPCDVEETPLKPESVPCSEKKVVAAAIGVAKALDLRKRAVAAAVSVLLHSAPASAAGQPTEISHAWQVVHRLDQVNLRNQSFNRKPRGESR